MAQEEEGPAGRGEGESGGGEEAAEDGEGDPPPAPPWGPWPPPRRRPLRRRRTVPEQSGFAPGGIRPGARGEEGEDFTGI